MSRKELNRIEMLEKLASKQLSQKAVAEQLGVSDRQVRRWQESYHRQGVQGIISHRRGKPSNNRLSAELKQEAIVS